MRSRFKRPTIASFREWDKIDKEHKDKHPIDYFFFQFLPIKCGRIYNRIHDGWWWVKYRICPWHWYGIVFTGLGFGYFDHSERILHATMKEVCDFAERTSGWMYVEDSKGNFGKKYKKKPSPNIIIELLQKSIMDYKHDEYHSSESHAKGEADLVKIYKWWNITRPLLVSKTPKYSKFTEGGMTEWWAYSENNAKRYINEKDKECMHLVAENYLWMWT